MSDQKSFSGRTRSRKTRMSVRVVDVTARSLISVGGIGTIVAVTTVCLFLASVVVPLFLPAETELHHETEGIGPAQPVHVAIDEYRSIAFAIDMDGSIVVFKPDVGTVLDERSLTPDRKPTAWSFLPKDDVAVIGFEDGTVQLYRMGFRTSFLDEETVPESFFRMATGDLVAYGDGVVERTPEGQFRKQALYIEPIGDASKIADNPVRGVSHVVDGETTKVVALAAGDGETGSLFMLRATERENMMTGAVTLRIGPPQLLPLPQRTSGTPAFVRLAGIADNAYVAWPDGQVARIRLTGPDAPFLAETLDLVSGDDSQLTSLEFLLGGATLIAGDSAGRISGWFPAATDADPDGEGVTDGFRLAKAKTLPSGRSGVTCIQSGTRRRMFAVGYEDGSLAIFHMTDEVRLTQTMLPDSQRIMGITMAPKEDGLLALAERDAVLLRFDPGYPEASFRTLFAPVWYEGYSTSQFMWQSSSASDDFEPKLSLIPLIFGSIKATLYSMIFGVPVALLAAIYTSEFLDPRWKSWVKPTIELMASLPSVVLGFLAALVFAPYIEKYLAPALTIFFTIPLAFLVGAYIWQLLPRRFTLRNAKRRMWFVLAALPFGVVAALAVGPAVEAMLFGSDLNGWLNGLHLEPKAGHALGGWVVLLLPLTAVAVGIFMSLFVNPRIRRWTEHMPRQTMAGVDLIKFLVGALLTIAIVLIIGSVLGAAGFDIRGPMPLIGSLADTYDQRNALVVGVVMGFAIIPIIYTIAEDALSTVPEHLRGASLGAGATPWQTAVRIIIPTAMSGLFSAMMIGLGRAVGETMIVLMALGNTPVMDIQPFNGARTLAANIAVEMPEAPQGETHYRTLFLAALTLFAMTFVVNTVAEVVRLRFRKRAYQL
jgi:phosphate transport system permease protein